MTKWEAKANLKEIRAWLDDHPGPWGITHPDLAKAYRMIYNEAHYKACLLANIHPDSVIHYTMIEEGKGTPWE